MTHDPKLEFAIWLDLADAPVPDERARLYAYSTGRDADLAEPACASAYRAFLEWDSWEAHSRFLDRWWSEGLTPEVDRERRLRNAHGMRVVDARGRDRRGQFRLL